MEEKVVLMYGGSFNPPINSHFTFANKILEEYNQIEKLVFVPVNNKYNKQGLIENEHRYNMLKLGCMEDQNIEVSRIEIDNEILHTIETLEILKSEYKENKIWFMIGTDNFKMFETWKEAEKLLENYKVMVIEREKDKVEDIIKKSKLLSKYSENIIKVKSNIKSNMSSTQVKEMIKNKEDISALVPAKVIQYIKENNLYGG